MNTIKKIAEDFSCGNFDSAFDIMNDNTVWEIVGEKRIEGKDSIIDYCNGVSSYFKSVTTDFRILNTIQEGSRVAINGEAAFFRDDQRVSFVCSCDVYEFNQGGFLEKITSYCITCS